MHAIIERLYLGLAKSVKASRTWNSKVISLGWASITSWTYSATLLSSFTETASRAIFLLARCCAGAFTARWAHGTRLNGKLESQSSTSITCKYVKPMEWKGYIILHFEMFFLSSFPPNITVRRCFNKVKSCWTRLITGWMNIWSKKPTLYSLESQTGKEVINHPSHLHDHSMWTEFQSISILLQGFSPDNLVS